MCGSESVRKRGKKGPGFSGFGKWLGTRISPLRRVRGRRVKTKESQIL